MTKRDRFEAMVEKEYKKWLKGDQVAGWLTIPLTLLRREHASVVRSVKKIKQEYMQAQAESERIRDHSAGLAEREAESDVTHLQFGIDACNDILAMLDKRKEAKK